MISRLSKQNSNALEEAYERFHNFGYTSFPASLYYDLVGEQAKSKIPQVRSSFSELVPDTFMGDGGSYRFRAYSRFKLCIDAEGDPSFSLLEGNSIFQTKEDNPINGGVVRTFAPLSEQVYTGVLLKSLLEWDYRHAFHCDPSFFKEPVVVGVHQVRILARTGAIGHPAPEGVHRDRERFTFQHFIDRHNINGGEFRAHDQAKEVKLAWLQQNCLDTVMFEGSTWHSATPISVASPSLGDGYRDIFLIDFDPAS